MEILRRTPWSRIREQNSMYKEFLEIVGNGETNGQCVKGDNCSFRHDMNKRGKLTQPNSFMQQNERKPSRTRSPRGKSPSGRMSRWPCKDYLKGTCTNSFCEKWHPPECLFYKTKSGCRFGESALMRIARLMNSLAKGLKRMVTKSAVAMLKKHESYDRTVKPVVCRDTSHERHGPVVCNSSNTRQLGCVFQDMEPPKSSSTLRKSSDMRKPIQRVKVTKAVARHAYIRDQNPSLGYVCPGEPHQRGPQRSKILRIGLRRRQSGKSKVPAKQCGGWPKVC